LKNTDSSFPISQRGVRRNGRDIKTQSCNDGINDDGNNNNNNNNKCFLYYYFHLRFFIIIIAGSSSCGGMSVGYSVPDDKKDKMVADGSRGDTVQTGVTAD
jgi:hypothetical protein